jgi:DNA replication licensing factor MCM5
MTPWLADLCWMIHRVYLRALCGPQHKATSITVQCRSCKGTMTITCSPGMGGAMVPNFCPLNRNPLPGTEKCEQSPFVVSECDRV